MATKANSRFWSAETTRQKDELLHCDNGPLQILCFGCHLVGPV